MAMLAITIGGIPHDSIGNHLFTVQTSGSDEDPELDPIDLRFDVKITPRNIEPIWNLPFQLQAVLGRQHNGISRPTTGYLMPTETSSVSIP